MRKLENLSKRKNAYIDKEKAIYEGVIIPTIMYGLVTWILNASERSLEVSEMKFLNHVCSEGHIQCENGSNNKNAWKQ